MNRSVALGVFFSHWMREETDQKKKVYFTKVEEACQHILENRRRIKALLQLDNILLNIFINGSPQEIDMASDLYRTFVRKLVDNREIVGVCFLCKKGIVRIEPREISMGAAVCSHCRDCRFQLDDVFQFAH